VVEGNASTTETPQERKRLPRAVFHLIAAVLALGVLAAMLYPSYVHERASARMRQCLRNLKQLGLGLKQYVQDFDEKYPWSVGRTDSGRAWRDLGLLYPDYVDEISVYLCPGSKDRQFDPMSPSGSKADRPFEPFRDRADERISYSYCFDARSPEGPGPWSASSPRRVRLLADKKAGTVIGSPDNPVKMANHGEHGRNVLLQDGGARWWGGKRALDPDPDDDEIGPPGLADYTAWWSDPPYYGE
jgi:hypothetical protein